MAEAEKKGLAIKIAADTSEFEDAIDRCIAKAKALGDELERVGAVYDATPIARESRS